MTTGRGITSRVLAVLFGLVLLIAVRPSVTSAPTTATDRPAGSNSNVRRELDSLHAQQSAGSLNPGGTKALYGTGRSYARGVNGARLFFRTVDGGVQIVAKASKANESRLIARLQATYGG